MTQSVVANRFGQGIARGSSGTFTGDATAVNVNLGFKPKYVMLVNLTDAVKWEKLDGMSTTQCLKTVTGGTMTVDTGSAITLNDGTVSGLAPGFTVSATADVTGKSFAWFAE